MAFSSDNSFSKILINRRLLWFGSIMFFVFFADVIMSYASPIFIQAKMNNAFLMGLIISSSSIVGLIADLLISKQFAQKEYRFFARWLIALALFFPISILVMPAQPLTFLFVMAIWGIYFEFISFSQFNFVHSVVSRQSHTAAWGMLDAFKAIAAISAPIAATFLLQISIEITMYAVISSLVIALISFFFYRRSFPDKKISTPLNENSPQTYQKRGFWQEIVLWKILMKKIWPMYLFFFSFILLESALWTVGPLLSEAIRKDHPLGGFLLSAYMLPSLITPPLSHFLSTKFSKKRVAFISALIGSSILAIGSFFFGHSPWLTLVIFCSSIFYSLDYPAIEAVFEDYLSRIDGYSNDLIGLQNTSTSISYILGPMLAGFLASKIGLSATIGVFALYLGCVALFLLIVTPKKITMPHGQLAKVSDVPS